MTKEATTTPAAAEDTLKKKGLRARLGKIFSGKNSGKASKRAAAPLHSGTHRRGFFVPLFFLALLGVGLAFKFAPETPDQNPAANPFNRFSFTRTVAEASRKVLALKEIESRNQQLELENAQLRNQLQSKAFAQVGDEARLVTKKTKEALKKDTGSPVGRNLAAIAYHPPGQLSPNQLYTLGVAYFKAHEDEKAAVLFTHVTEVEESSHFKTAANFLVSGVAWYRIENYEMADHFFDKVLAFDHKDDEHFAKSEPFFAQARLWKALSAKKQGDGAKSQAWLKTLLDHHPQSKEAALINTAPGAGIPRSTIRKINRTVASETEAHHE